MLAKLRTMLLICVAVLLIQVPPITFAQRGDQEAPPPVVLSEDEAYARDAEAYAVAFGVKVDEAIYRLKLQKKIAELDAKLQTQEKATFAGMWIEHTPRFRVVAQFTRGANEVVAPYVEKGPLAGLVEAQNAPISLEQLRIEHLNVIRYLQITGIPAESNTDLKANGINVYVTNRKQLEDALLTANLQLSNNVEIIEISQLSQPMANWYAGYSLSQCTAGFSLRKTSDGTKYSSTAGHCQSGDISPLGAPVLSKDTGAYDFQVNPAPSGYILKNWAADNIYDGTPYYREITGWFATPATVGSSVCKWGKTTSFTCGTVEANDFSEYGSPTWLLVKSSNPNVKISCGGDSGAPVYTGSTAVGALHGGWCDLSNNKFVAMPRENIRITAIML